MVHDSDEDRFCTHREIWLEFLAIVAHAKSANAYIDGEPTSTFGISEIERNFPHKLHYSCRL